MTEHPHHHKQFHGSPERLHTSKRAAMLEIPRVVTLSLADLKIASVLDAGTGSGLFAQAFAEQAMSVTGMDLSPQMLAFAREHIPGAAFVRARMEALPFRRHAFDLIFLSHVLHETDDLTGTLAELYRCARLRVAVLEWPYVDEPAGPPLRHRLRPETVIRQAHQADFGQVEALPLHHMTLYLLTKTVG